MGKPKIEEVGRILRVTPQPGPNGLVVLGIVFGLIWLISSCS